MVGQKLAWGKGVSWPLTTGEPAVHVPDLAASVPPSPPDAPPPATGEPGATSASASSKQPLQPYFFRDARDVPGGEAARSGAEYFTAPVTGCSGELLGMLAVDTLCAPPEPRPGLARRLAPTDLAFVADLATALSVRAQDDQEAYTTAQQVGGGEGLGGGGR